jgi:cyclase
VIPALLLRGSGLVKTVEFGAPKYVGDPRNAVKIFNEKEVDELALLDITATPEGRDPRYDLIEEIVSEAFMPVAYGGGVNDVEQASRIIALGVEKVLVNTAAVERPQLVTELAEGLGSQSVVVSIDVRRRRRGRMEVMTHCGTKRTKLGAVEAAVRAEELGAGELLLTSIDRDGTQAGYDLELVKSITDAVSIPVIASGGAGSTSDLAAAVEVGGASAVAAGSLFVFQGRHRAVMINYPAREELDEVLGHG